MPRRYTPFIDGFWEKVSKSEGCWLWKGATRGGRYNQYGNYRGRMAHRVSWEIKHGQSVPQFMFVLHKCDQPLCVNPSHIFLGTARDNAIDMFNKGRSPITKLNFAAAEEIRKLHREGVKQSKLAEKYQVSRPCVCDIISGKRWSRSEGDVL